jgi:hypothetical protein
MQSRSRTPIRLRPVDPPPPIRYRHPVQALWRCSPDMVVQRSGALVETSCMPRVGESEPLKVEMVAELMAECAEEGSKRGDLLLHRRARPHPDQHALRRVVSKKLCNRVFPNSQRSRCQHANTAGFNVVELRCGRQKINASASDNRSCPVCHCQFDGFGKGKQTAVLWQVERPDAVTFQKPITVLIAWRNVRQH